MNSKPVVAHLVRHYLAKTETFIYSQITRHHKFDPFVFSHSQRPWAQTLFPFQHVTSFANNTGFRTNISDKIYQLSRVATAFEKSWFNNELAKIEPIILHAHYAVDASFFSWLKSIFDVPLIVSCYGYDVSGFPSSYGGLGKLYLRRAFKSADLFLAMSEDMMQDLIALGCPPEKIAVHYYGIDLNRFYFVDRAKKRHQAIRILFVGSLIHKKGVEELLEAFFVLAKHYKHIELRYVGQGPLMDKLKERAHNYVLNARISFAGFVEHDKLMAELANADIFCHPSQVDSYGNKEGIPGTIVEAMATGLPVVATNHAGIPDAVIEGETGYLVDEGDVKGLVDRLSVLIETLDLRIRLGYQGHLLAQKTANADVQLKKLEMIYNNQIQRYRRKQSG